MAKQQPQTLILISYTLSSIPYVNIIDFNGLTNSINY